MALHISQPQYQRMQEVLETAYPQEGCGVLVGKRIFGPGAAEPQTTPGIPRSSQEAYRQVMQVIPVANAWEPGLLEEGGSSSHGAGDSHPADPQDQPNPHGAHDRYWIDPADLLRIQREARDQALDIIGIFHSHPDHPAVPSECDRRLAWPGYSYVIAAVRGGQATDVQSWRLSDRQQNDHQQFEPETITILDATANNSPVLA